MDYFYENLGDEKFQEFCHSLLNKEFPNSQTFPVGQRDGGRDSISYIASSTKKDFIVFQVKYVREPHKIQDIHKWFTKIVEEESPKVNKLIDRGAKGYYILTNVRGTAFLDSGSIDRVNTILEGNISIPAICWWRDDISRKLEGYTDLQWSYAEILHGQDVLNSLIFQHVNENKDRRDAVIRAYLADQYDLDNEVKFKQIELQNRLFDLFIDVPISLKQLPKNINRYQQVFKYLPLQTRMVGPSFFVDDSDYNEKQEVGAAFFLMNYLDRLNIKRTLLEGGPGQGKSTITQFICQVNRIRILNKETEIEALPSNIRLTGLRLPFKVDLRDLASWVSKKNPYPSYLPDDTFLSKWQKSLEAFLVCHICYHSKFIEFDTADFIAICRLSSVLFVFDGFDEIADLKIREEIVEVINKGLNRINENSKSLQVIITSRPAAFASSSGFSIDEYPHFELKDINFTIINQYVEKWIVTRKIREREANEIRRLVREKLQLPHLKDLAKSPMQLAILISLLSTRGESLPNRRTELYDSYVELFFNREAEKNPTVREERDLVMDIHQYLAWKLHSDAELHNSNGRIETAKLKELLKLYLEHEGHPIDIADTLFAVVEERVCALVSRVLGTFEFEVQPLREYFCAKYLYKTSPYAPPGKEVTGTKPERFEALSKNFYWQNVMRFFAGCFDRGELPMLILKLQELQENKYFKYTNYPRILTSQLLSDYVFSGYPRLLTDVVKIILDGINIRAILSENNRSARTEGITVPEKCGREEIVLECFNQLRKFPAEDYSAELIEIINSNPYKTFELWEGYGRELQSLELTRWLEYGYLLRLFYKIDLKEIVYLFNRDNKIDSKRLQILINANRIDVLTSYFKKEVVDKIADNKITFSSRKRNNKYALENFSFSTNPEIFSSLFEYNENLSLTLNQYISYRNERLYFGPLSETEGEFRASEKQDNIDASLETFFSSIEIALNSPIQKWMTMAEPWEILIESGRLTFGDKAVFKILATLAAGIKSTDDRFSEFEVLTDSTKPLVKRIRSARLKSGNISWWKSQLASSTDLALTLLVLFTWCTPRTLVNLIPVIEEKLKELGDNGLEALFLDLEKTTLISKLNTVQTRQLINDLKSKNSSHVLNYIISLRLSYNNTSDFVNRFLLDYTGNNKNILQLKLETLLQEFLSGNYKAEMIQKIKAAYLLINNFRQTYYMFHHYNHQIVNIPYETAKSIVQDAKNLPRILVSVAESVCRRHANKKIQAVGLIANKNNWFEI